MYNLSALYYRQNIKISPNTIMHNNQKYPKFPNNDNIQIYIHLYNTQIIYIKNRALMINKFARNASKYSYYGYLTRYEPEHLRKYQSQRLYSLGRRGAFNTLVYKYAADHINYEEDFNLRYKIPSFFVNTSMRLAMFWFISATVILSFGLGDMLRVFRQIEFYYPGKPDTKAETVSRYETLYFIDKKPKF